MSSRMTLVYPHPAGTSHTYIAGGVPGGLHETAGLPHYPALDFMAPGGTRFLAPERGTITEFSGHNPALGEVEPGIYGWNIYFRTPGGIGYFITHLENRYGHVGLHFAAGTILGHVGHWPHDPGRSHSHIGCNHPAGDKAGRDHICAVARAPHVHGVWL